MNNPCYHLTGYGGKIQVVFLQTKIRTLERVINTSFHCVQAAHPQLELALRRIFIDYRGGGFCVFQSLIFHFMESYNLMNDIQILQYEF